MANNDLLVQSGLQSVQNNVTSQSKSASKQSAPQTGFVTESSASEDPVQTNGLEQQKEQQQQRTDALREKVAQLNDYMQNLNRNLQFSIDEASGDTVVKVIDADTEEVVRQIPSEEVLKTREAVEKYRGILLETKV